MESLFVVGAVEGLGVLDVADVVSSVLVVELGIVLGGAGAVVVSDILEGFAGDAPFVVVAFAGADALGGTDPS